MAAATNTKAGPIHRSRTRQHFAAFKKSPFYVPFVHTLFWTGARPSELLALNWGDLDLRSGFITTRKSRYIDEEGAPKTAGSDRSIKLIGSVIEILKRLKPVRTTENDYVFLNQEANPLNFHTWRAVFGIES